MALSPRTRLGVYEVTAQIGEGGMGQVYRATDTKLKRQVAIKILPPSLAADSDRLARFQREAEVLASLNHPNIAHIHGLEESGGITALVMELVEGEDLSQRIARGAVPLAEALPIAKQIAEALEAAHQQGIIHRDLKPANIKVRADDTVKVLDFGLAKAMEPAGSSLSLSMSPTITTPSMTHAGTILGTAAYMSPEQARGKTVDRRADIWAFGAVVYEMLTGQRAFGGDGVQDTLAAIMRDEPDWARLPATLSPALATFIRRCLHKDLRQRIHDIADVRLALEGAFEAVVPHAPASAARPTSAAARAMSWVSSAAALVFAIAWLTVWAAWRAERPVDRPLVWLDVDLGTNVSLPDPGAQAQGSSVAISPDGTRLAWLSGTPTKLFTRRLDEPKAIELPGTEAAMAPFFSPDGQWVGFLSLGRVNKISVEGGAVVPLGEIRSVGASWGQDGSIFVGQFAKGLLRIPDSVGPPETVLGVGAGELALAAPQILPGGRAILFVADPGLDVDKNTIEVLTLADGKRKIVARGGQSPRYLATSDRTGHLVYVNRATLFAVPFDLDTLEARGTAVPVLDDVAYAGSVGTGHFDVSQTGTLVYRRAGAARLTTVQWVDPLGKKESLLAKPGLYWHAILSPDGTRVALTVSERGTRYDVWVYDSQRDIMTRLTSDGFNSSPTWSPDGRYVLFSPISRGIFQARADGASRPQALTPSKITQLPRSFMPDGKRLAYVDQGSGERNAQIWTVALEEQGNQWTVGTPEPFLKSSFADQAPSFSPDGRWLAYHSNESGTNEVFVRAFPPTSSGHGGKWQVSNSGGTVPRWSRSAHELVYQMGDQIMAARYAVNGDTFVAEKPRVWIAKLGGTEWDLAADGKRVVVVAPVASAEAPKQEHQVVFLQNFFDELRRRVPLGK